MKINSTIPEVPTGCEHVVWSRTISRPKEGTVMDTSLLQVEYDAWSGDRLDLFNGRPVVLLGYIKGPALGGAWCARSLCGQRDTLHGLTFEAAVTYIELQAGG